MTKKSILSRIRVTRRGKLIRRPMGAGHFRAKKSGKQTRQKRKTMLVKAADVKAIRKYL